MKAKADKVPCTVHYQPLRNKGYFDIKSPEKGSGGKEKRKRPAVSSPFLTMAFIIFVFFAGLGFYENTREFFKTTEEEAFAGYGSLKEGAKALSESDFQKAGLYFESAREALEAMNTRMGFLTSQANRYLKNHLYLEAGQKLIESGLAVARIGKEMTSFLQEIRMIPSVLIQQNLPNPSPEKKVPRLTDLIREQESRLQRVFQESLLIQQNLTTLNKEVLPEDLKRSLESVQELLGKWLAVLRETQASVLAIQTLLGDKVPHRYLVLMQNNHELRATGGFIGSYLLIDVNEGAIASLQSHDVYETDGQLTDVIPPPPGIDRVADRWYLRDANYSPDFAVSAQKIMWFLEHSQGPSADTVIAIDQTVAEKLLELTGPVQLTDFPLMIRADNFNDLFSFHAESKLSNSASPKQLLFDFIPVFREKIFHLKKVNFLMSVIQELISGRHIQVYSADPEVQALIEKGSADGKMIQAPSTVDFLSVITTSIGGNKSDAFIHSVIGHHTVLSAQGKITDTLALEKRHAWTPSAFAPWKAFIDRYGTGKLSETTLRFIQGEGDNVDYLRMYVPRGSRLTAIEGVAIEEVKSFEDLGYTVFAFTWSVSAGQTKTVKLSYELPIELDVNKSADFYRFIAQKQAGAENITFKKSLQTSEGLSILKTYPPTESSVFTLYPSMEVPFTRNEYFVAEIGKQ